MRQGRRFAHLPPTQTHTPAGRLPAGRRTATMSRRRGQYRDRPRRPGRRIWYGTLGILWLCLLFWILVLLAAVPARSLERSASRPDVLSRDAGRASALPDDSDPYVPQHEGEDLSTLEMVIEVCRHGARAPLSTYPNDPRPYTRWPVGPGELTLYGAHRQYQLGQHMRAEYGQVIPQRYQVREVYIRSSNINRALMSAYAQAAGLFAADEAYTRGDEQRPRSRDAAGERVSAVGGPAARPPAVVRVGGAGTRARRIFGSTGARRAGVIATGHAGGRRQRLRRVAVRRCRGHRAARQRDCSGAPAGGAPLSVAVHRHVSRNGTGAIVRRLAGAPAPHALAATGGRPTIRTLRALLRPRHHPPGAAVGAGRPAKGVTVVQRHRHLGAAPTRPRRPLVRHRALRLETADGARLRPGMPTAAARPHPQTAVGGPARCHHLEPSVSRPRRLMARPRGIGRNQRRPAAVAAAAPGGVGGAVATIISAGQAIRPRACHPHLSAVVTEHVLDALWEAPNDPDATIPPSHRIASPNAGREKMARAAARDGAGHVSVSSAGKPSSAVLPLNGRCLGGCRLHSWRECGSPCRWVLGEWHERDRCPPSGFGKTLVAAAAAAGGGGRLGGAVGSGAVGSGGRLSRIVAGGAGSARRAPLLVTALVDGTVRAFEVPSGRQLWRVNTNGTRQCDDGAQVVSPGEEARATATAAPMEAPTTPASAAVPSPNPTPLVRDEGGARAVAATYPAIPVHRRETRALTVSLRDGQVLRRFAYDNDVSHGVCQWAPTPATACTPSDASPKRLATDDVGATSHHNSPSPPRADEILVITRTDSGLQLMDPVSGARNWNAQYAEYDMYLMDDAERGLQNTMRRHGQQWGPMEGAAVASANEPATVVKEDAGRIGAYPGTLRAAPTYEAVLSSDSRSIAVRNCRSGRVVWRALLPSAVLAVKGIGDLALSMEDPGALADVGGSQALLPAGA
eukprot:ctg_1125.g382